METKREKIKSRHGGASEVWWSPRCRKTRTPRTPGGGNRCRRGTRPTERTPGGTGCGCTRAAAAATPSTGTTTGWSTVTRPWTWDCRRCRTTWGTRASGLTDADRTAISCGSCTTADSVINVKPYNNIISYAALLSYLFCLTVSHRERGVHSIRPVGYILL